MDLKQNNVAGKVNMALKINMVLYEAHVTALEAVANSYDRAILSLSTASLGFTFAFIRVFRPVRLSINDFHIGGVTYVCY